ncbi:hypothetical protein AVEN_269310-1 [Araneus ventricosus]|uniref:Uncharacterized protein n=1 Tax=Araneus ventricosus TaxID=182803 RepID=A0A4Y2I431_ARAVE|nr:hypothetical protein AVEN_269310-1 [Araneus ventricosus]
MISESMEVMEMREISILKSNKELPFLARPNTNCSNKPHSEKRDIGFQLLFFALYFLVFEAIPPESRFNERRQIYQTLFATSIGSLKTNHFLLKTITVKISTQIEQSLQECFRVNYALPEEKNGRNCDFANVETYEIKIVEV